MKYTGEQRLRAVRLYERYGRSAVAVIDELGVSVWADVGGLASVYGCGPAGAASSGISPEGLRHEPEDLCGQRRAV